MTRNGRAGDADDKVQDHPVIISGLQKHACEPAQQKPARKNDGNRKHAILPDLTNDAPAGRSPAPRGHWRRRRWGGGRRSKRTEERSGGEEGGRTCKSRESPD